MRQQDLIERAERVLRQDHRVLGVWLAGSFAKGTADQFSDVDLWVVVEPDDVAGFCADWPELSDEIAPTVLRQQVGNLPIFNQVTAEWLRFDVSVGTPDEVAQRTTSTVKPLYDPRGLSAGLGAPGPGLQPDPRRVEALGHEFLRVLGLLPVVVGRDEFVVGQSGANLLRTMLIQLMIEDVEVADRGGALHLNPLLPDDRLQALAALPPMSATRDSVIAAHVACAAAFLPLARKLHARCGLEWPQELEDAARRHLATALRLSCLPSCHGTSGVPELLHRITVHQARRYPRRLPSRSAGGRRGRLDEAIHTILFGLAYRRVRHDRLARAAIGAGIGRPGRPRVAMPCRRGSGAMTGIDDPGTRGRRVRVVVVAGHVLACARLASRSRRMSSPIILACLMRSSIDTSGT